jgi:hypothetical protein
MNYSCKRCGYETNFKANMKSHLDRLKKCSKNISCIDKDDEELYNMSLNPNKSNNNIHCKICNKNYSRIDSYNRHLKNNKKCNSEKVNNITLNNISNSNITYGDTINNNINNNINVYIIPFDNKWSIEHINNKDKCHIVSSLMKYTTLLNELLENDENLNVIVEENTNEALIFKNNEDKYVNIKKKDLYSKTMKELKNILIEMTNEIINSNDSNINYSTIIKNSLKSELLTIMKKYEDYEKNNKVLNNANISLEKVFINKKNDAEIIAKKMIESNGY